MAMVTMCRACQAALLVDNRSYQLDLHRMSKTLNFRSFSMNKFNFYVPFMPFT